MNLYAIETVVRRLFADAAFRAAAVADPAAALAEYRLAAEEQAALTKLCAQLAGGATLARGGATVNWLWWA
ncbi:MAG TPA: Os1348 family NHLP clan protein [Thermomicrobiales bacterium]|nr:Os1348 family NHLP clan protein [Thermomicrobiales bacterium]